VGFDFLETFRRLRKSFLVIDHDPEIIGQLNAAKVEHRYGDGSDLEFLETLELSDADIVVSTIPDVETNLLIAHQAKRGAEEPPTVMAVAHNISNALELYDGGVDYVILPHFLGGRYASSMVQRFLGHAEAVEEAKKEQLQYLKKRAALGHEHPMIERFR
jgi:Trk K+ transport system NAD-binding subunit